MKATFRSFLERNIDYPTELYKYITRSFTTLHAIENEIKRLHGNALYCNNNYYSTITNITTYDELSLERKYNKWYTHACIN